jgi:hypothetical protein
MANECEWSNQNKYNNQIVTYSFEQINEHPHKKLDISLAVMHLRHAIVAI